MYYVRIDQDLTSFCLSGWKKLFMYLTQYNLNLSGRSSYDILAFIIDMSTIFRRFVHEFFCICEPSEQKFSENYNFSIVELKILFTCDSTSMSVFDCALPDQGRL